jgi:prolyl 4-hydroxylase
MSLIAHAEQMARSGRQHEAVALVEKSAQEGDPDALFMCANWRLLGLYGPRDLVATHALLGAAAEHGHLEAARLHAALVGNGTGLDSDPGRARTMLEGLAARDPEAAVQLSLLNAMSSTEASPLHEELSREPPVRLIRKLLTEAECAYVGRQANPALKPSLIFDPKTRRPMPNPVRNSVGMNFGPWAEDLVVHSLNLRIAKASATDVRWGEPLHVLRYDVGQEFKPHLDALPGVANQRRWTVLVYLNEDYIGGETDFPELGLRVRGETGDALLFENAGADGRADERTRHAGLEVRSGTKWLASRWIRSGPITPWDAELV